MTAKAPELSVMVTVVEGEPALSRCLEALTRQEGGPSMEVIIPYDDTVAEVGKLAEKFPQFIFMNLGKIAADDAPLNPFTEHEYFDRRRSAGLAAAKGRLIAMLEDRGAPAPDWAKLMVEEADRTGAAVIGGAVVNVAPGTINKALFYCDYGRYSPPFEEKEAEYLTDINLCYSRKALEETRSVWGERYLEASVHWTLRDNGGLLLLSPKPTVLHERGKAPLSRIISERLHWGRIYGITRAARWTKGRALVAAAASVVLPLLLLVRHTKAMSEKGVKGGEIAKTVPGMMVVLPFWCLGEAMGYIQGAGKTDLLTKTH